jgi:hypothetical protein
MMEVHQIIDLTLAGNFTFPTTSTGEVGKVGKQALNQHPHHHLSRGCGGVVGVARGVDFTGGEILALSARLQMLAECRPPISDRRGLCRQWRSSPVDNGGILTIWPTSPGVGL